MSEPAIRLIAAVAALIIMSMGFAHAQTVQKVEIYEFGTYTSSPETQVGWSHQGRRKTVADEIYLLDATQTVVARIGIQFGFRFRISGQPGQRSVPVKLVMKIPPPGMLAAQNIKPIMADEYAWFGSFGARNFFTLSFEERSDLVPGIWTFEIWIAGKKQAERKFNVILPPIANRQSPALLASGKVG